METFLKHLKENWVILLFLGSVIVSWTMFSARLTQAEQDIVDLRIVVNQINEINLKLAVIQEHINNIDNKLK